MKAKTQALLLEKMMQKHHSHHICEIALPDLIIKKSSLYQLSVGDILLTGLKSLEPILVHYRLSHTPHYAKLLFLKNTSRRKVKITSIHPIQEKPLKDTKHEVLKSLFAHIEVNPFECGSMIELDDSLFDSVSLFNQNYDIKVEGKLMNAEGKIAIEITKVSI